ncbi:hypothetical protein [Streptomyces sp. NPDC048385]|uniref:hypothetical protein n=1 Tax=unclassified Streptomyces TaxID=2593676 RepID=UPI00341EABA1
MSAQDLAQPYPFVTTDDDATHTARLRADQALPALLVPGSGGHPAAVVPESQMIRRLLPAYITDAPLLAGVMRERLDGELLSQADRSHSGRVDASRPVPAVGRRV